MALKGQVDLSLYFFAASLNLLKPGGHLGFLMPGKILQARYAATLRAYLKDFCCLDYLFDFGIDHNFLFHADTFPLAIGITRARPDSEQAVFIEKHGKEVFQSFHTPQKSLDPLAGIWPLVEPALSGVLQKTKDWPRLGDLAATIRRGVVTGNKKAFVFRERPAHLPKNRLKLLLRGRDIQANELRPGRWIYWPFEDGPDWFGRAAPRERQWLLEDCKIQPRGDRARLPYRAPALKTWILVWKYLASQWQAALIRTNWAPDQTTYFMDFDDFERAYRCFTYLNSKTAETLIQLIAERAKDRCFFYYAHTCAALPIPPDLMTRPLKIPAQKDCFTPAEADTDWEPLLTDS